MIKQDVLSRIVRLEYLFAAVVVALFYVTIGGFAWYWLFLLFVLFDVSMVGYLVSKRTGAITYNIGHSLIGPAIVLTIFIMTSASWALFLTLVWLFHILVDRALGYGLKYSKGFEHTHLGKIGGKHKG